MTSQLGLDFERKKQEAGPKDLLAHLGPNTVASINNVIQVVADQKARFTWEDVKARLPEGVLQILALPNFKLRAGGALMKNAAKTLGLQRFGYVEAKADAAKGRPIREWGKAA